MRSFTWQAWCWSMSARLRWKSRMSSMRDFRASSTACRRKVAIPMWVRASGLAGSTMVEMCGYSWAQSLMVHRLTLSTARRKRMVAPSLSVKVWAGARMAPSWGRAPAVPVMASLRSTICRKDSVSPGGSEASL